MSDPDKPPQMTAQRDVAQGFHLFMDGNMWCAIGPHFECLAISNAGFGPTRAEAVADLNSHLRRERWWNDKALPTVEKFTVHHPTT